MMTSRSFYGGEQMTTQQKRLAIAEALFVALWLMMNFFWMWSLYSVSNPLAVPTAIAAVAAVWFTERTVTAICITGSNVGWFLKDAVWMLENAGRMPSGLWWGTFFFAFTLLCIVVALVTGGFSGTLYAVTERLRRISLLFPK